MTLWRAATSLAAPHRREENVPVMIFDALAGDQPVGLAGRRGRIGGVGDREDELLAHHAAALVDEVAHDLEAFHVALALEGEVARERLEHADLVLAGRRLPANGVRPAAEKDRERHDDDGEGDA
jgi:hypothetical protein